MKKDYQIAIDLLNEAKSLLSNVKVDDYKNKYETEINEGYDVIEGRWNEIIEKLNEPEVQPSEPETTEPVIQPEPKEVEEIQPSEPEENPKQEEEDEDEIVDKINP